MRATKLYTANMPPLFIFQLAGLLLGLLLGSFLNVCIARAPYGRSIVTPGSHCPVCRHPIRWYDNIPVVSWLLLRGRCRDCGAKVSWVYPAVELAYGLWFLLAALPIVSYNLYVLYEPHWPSAYQSIHFLQMVILGFLLIGLTVIDWQTHRLPDSFTLSGIVAGLFLVCTQTLFLLPGEHQVIFASKHLRLSSPGSFAARGNVFITGTEALIYGRLLAVVGAALILLIVRWTYKALRKRDGLGLGDVKLLAMIAAFLGFEQTVLTLFLGTLLATIYGIYLLSRRQANALTRLPFGSFLSVAGLFAALRGEQIIGWYTSLFR